LAGAARAAATPERIARTPLSPSDVSMVSPGSTVLSSPSQLR
jgi:hypothetical protein